MKGRELLRLLRALARRRGWAFFEELKTGTLLGILKDLSIHRGDLDRDQESTRVTAYAYPARITRAREGGWLIHFRDFPEGHSQAEDGEDVIDVAEGLLQACIEARLLDSMAVAEPTEARPGELLVSVPMETATKAALLSAVAASGTSRVALAKAVSMDEKEIRRMLDPRHSSKLPRLERVLKALGKELRISMVDAAKPPEARERKAKYRVTRKAPRKSAS